MTDPIRTEYWPKSIPIRRFDWIATRDGYDEGDPIGTGATEAEAIADLLKEEEFRTEPNSHNANGHGRRESLRPGTFLGDFTGSRCNDYF